MMARALGLARKAWGRTSPNPMVGAVVSRGERIIAEGYHARAGEAHAEAQALALAGSQARGATLYVTLEPCHHQGRTPPCTRTVLASGVRRVVACTRRFATSSCQHRAAVWTAASDESSKPARKFFFTYPTAFSTRPFSLAARTLQARISKP